MVGHLKILENGFCWRMTRWARLSSVNPQFGELWAEDLHTLHSSLFCFRYYNQNGQKKKSCLFMKSVPAKPAASALDERCSSRLHADEFQDNLMMTIRITAGGEKKNRCQFSFWILIMHPGISLFISSSSGDSGARVTESASQPTGTISGNNALHRAGNISCLSTFF